MSVIGPRPGLWNQDILTAERDKYNANDVKPGLTGWAQINGRDELEIPVKAKLDGEYVKKMGLLMDIKACFILSGIDEKGLLQSVDTAVEMNKARDFGIPVPDYIEENVSTKVVKIIQSYTGVVNKMVWRKEI